MPDYVILPPSLAFPAFAGACIGHTVLCVFNINWWSAIPMRRRRLGNLRRVLFSAMAFGPLLFWLTFEFPVPGVGRLPLPDGLRSGLLAYTLLCCVFGYLVLPAVTLARLLRPRPRALLSNHTHTVDVAACLGHKPIGRGKHRSMALLPGNQIFRVDFNEKTLRLPRLPAAWDGLTVLHLSDLHLHGTPDREFFRHVMDLCREWEPDLVAMTGDVVDTDHHHRWILPLLGRLRWRVAGFAILGNHDVWRDPPLIRRRLRRAGFRVPANTWEQIEVRGQPMVVIGHEGPWFRPGPDLAGCPEGVFRLCLSHTPDNIGWARRHDVDLMLSGHNHGGQVRFPVLGSVFAPSFHSRRYDSGTFDEPPTVLHVSRGLSGQHPLRYNCRPEVSKLVLRATENAA